MGVLVGILLVISVVSTAIVVALVTGVVSVAQLGGAAPKSNPGVTAAPTANAPTRPPLTVTKRETYGDWLYTCFEASQSKEVRCAIAQHLTDSKSDVTVFSWQIEQDGKGGLVGTWQTPRGVLLNRGIALDFGTPKPVSIPFETCGRQHCRAVAGLTPDYLAALATAAMATATLTLPNGKEITFRLGVKGLADGLAALKN